MSTVAPYRQVPAGVLAKIAAAEPSSTRHANIRDGFYLFEVQRLLSEQKRKAHCFIIELGVIASRPTTDPARPGIIPNAPKSTASVVVSFGNDSAGGNVSRFVCGLLGVNPEQMAVTDEKTGDFVRFMTAEERGEEIKSTYADLTAVNQPGRGMLIRGETYTYPIKSGPNAGKPFVGLNWIFVPGQTEQTIALRRQMLDAGVIGSPLCDVELAAGLSPVV